MNAIYPDIMLFSIIQLGPSNLLTEWLMRALITGEFIDKEPSLQALLKNSHATFDGNIVTDDYFLYP